MAYNENKRQYNIQYMKEHYKRVSLFMTPEKHEQIKKAAAQSGISVNAYINNALDKLLSEESPE